MRQIAVWIFGSLLTLSLLACHRNHPPEINGVRVNQVELTKTDEMVEIGITQKTSIQVFATDDDGDALTYTFTSNRRIFSETQNVTGKVSYMPPTTPGEDVIEIVVSDNDESDRWQIRMLIVENRGKVTIEVTWDNP
jgi:hypothetical protein